MLVQIRERLKHHSGFLFVGVRGSSYTLQLWRECLQIVTCTRLSIKPRSSKVNLCQALLGCCR